MTDAERDMLARALRLVLQGQFSAAELLLQVSCGAQGAVARAEILGGAYRAAEADLRERLGLPPAAEAETKVARSAAEQMTALRDAAREEAARMREALLRWQHSGCPDCGGDCGSANPPVSSCIVLETHAALAAAPGAGEDSNG